VQIRATVLGLGLRSGLARVVVSGNGGTLQ